MLEFHGGELNYLEILKCDRFVPGTLIATLGSRGRANMAALPGHGDWVHLAIM